jgi:hypothetical protein
LLDDLRAAQHAELLEVGSRRGNGIQGVRLLPKLADGDPHRCFP